MSDQPANSWQALHVISATLGVVAIVLSIFVSGYAAMAAGFVGGALAVIERGRGRTPAVILCALGFLLGLGAQVMKMIVDAHG